MATTSLWRVKGDIQKVLEYATDDEKTAVGRTELEKVLAYASREEATNKKQLVTGINCDPETAVWTMRETKKRFGKKNGTAAYHGYQSFAEGEVTPELAHQVGIDLAGELWGEKYEVVVCTHVDKDSHIHNHFVINTVSFVDGKKFYRSKSDYRQMQDVSDRLCHERGLSVIKNPEGKGKNYDEWNAERNGNPTYRGMIRKDIDAAVRASVTGNEFYKYLEGRGYEFKLYTPKGRPLQRPSLKPEGSERYFRFDRLGEGYALEDIMDRILSNKVRGVPFPEEDREKIRHYRKTHPPRTKAKGLAALYYHYCYELHIIEKFPASVKRVPFSMFEDIRKLERLDAQARLLGENGIETINDLERFRTEIENRLKEFEKIKAELRNAIRAEGKEGDSDRLKKLLSEKEKISDEIKKIRKTFVLCDGIEERSGKISGALMEIKQEGNETVKKKQEKEEKDGLFRGCCRADSKNEPQRN